MYNGIGLQTVRGSGTSGYVQANRSALKGHHLDRIRRERERRAMINGEVKPLAPPPGLRKANEELLMHDRKRAIEVQAIELEDELRTKR